ncbi:MAG: hypothetical protein IJM59_03805 [Proteobacteria bacterium]|nr:hypothetical protein [Pseudomonadota bacterium]
MTRLSRTITCCFIMLCMWWLAFSPGISAAFLPVFLPTAFVTFAACFLAQLRFKRIFALLYVAGILGMLFMTRGIWIFSPAVWGTLFVLWIASFHILNTSPVQNNTDIEQVSAPNLIRVKILFAIWILGITVSLFIPSRHTALILIAWSCLMLPLSTSVWSLTLSREWLGYTTRRDCFIGPDNWKKRFIQAAVGFILWIGAVTCWFCFVA